MPPDNNIRDRPMTICLCMIVKNEARVIERCLDSVARFVDTYAIMDTGSTDDTCERIARKMTGKPGVIEHRPWVDFSANRNQALELARGFGDYIFVIDADEVLETEHTTLPMAPPYLDSYMLAHRRAGTKVTFQKCSLFSASKPFRYECPVHEVLVCDVPFSQTRLQGAEIVGHFDSARNRNPQKYQDDAALLEAHILKYSSTDRMLERNLFYLAQSYRDAGMQYEALAAYANRIALDGDEQELWYARYMFALLQTQLSGLIGLRMLEEVWRSRPHRVEPLLRIAEFCAANGFGGEVERIRSIIAQLPPTTDTLFVEERP